MSKRNCPKCGKYLRNMRKSKRCLEDHQRDSVFCNSMTAEEHAARMKAAKDALLNDEPSDGAWFARYQDATMRHGL